MSTCTSHPHSSSFWPQTLPLPRPQTIQYTERPGRCLPLLRGNIEPYTPQHRRRSAIMSETSINTTTTQTSRRDFMKTSTAAVAGAALVSQALSTAVYGQGSDTIKVGLVGCGGRGSGAAVNALHADPGAKLVAM